MSDKIKEIYVSGGQGQTVTIPLKGHEKRSRAKFLKKYGPDAKAKGRIADPEEAWSKLESAIAQNKEADKLEKTEEDKAKELEKGKQLPSAGGNK